MIVEKKEVNPNTYEEINIIIKIEYPNIEYNDWKRTKEFNTDNDICNILDKILTNLNCKRVYVGLYNHYSKISKYTTKDIFTGKETYIYENLRTLEKINSNNPNLLEELDAPKKKKVKKKKEVGVPISSMTFSFKKEK